MCHENAAIGPGAGRLIGGPPRWTRTAPPAPRLDPPRSVPSASRITLSSSQPGRGGEGRPRRPARATAPPGHPGRARAMSAAARPPGRGPGSADSRRPERVPVTDPDSRAASQRAADCDSQRLGSDSRRGRGARKLEALWEPPSAAADGPRPARPLVTASPGWTPAVGGAAEWAPAAEPAAEACRRAPAEEDGHGYGPPGAS